MFALIHEVGNGTIATSEKLGCQQKNSPLHSNANIHTGAPGFCLPQIGNQGIQYQDNDTKIHTGSDLALS
jgi:hypothetical protein